MSLYNVSTFGSNIGSKPDRIRIYYQSDYSDKNVSTELNVEFINPSEISSSMSADITDHGTSKESALQFNETHRDKISLTLYVDTSNVVNTAQSNVKTKLEPLRALIMPTVRGADNKKLPLCRIVSGTDDFKGYIEHLKEEYVFFNSSGFPIRARVSITVRPVSSPEVVDKQNNTGNSRKAWIIKSGDRLDLIANRFYGNPALWRAIAEENNIANPLEFPLQEQLGQPLIIPDRMLIA